MQGIGLAQIHVLELGRIDCAVVKLPSHSSPDFRFRSFFMRLSSRLAARRSITPVLV